MAALIVLWVVFAVASFPCIAAAQVTAFLVRHADRLDWSNDSALSKAGEERAQRLAELLRHAGVTEIYVTEFQRTQKTAAPLARMLKIRPIILNHTDYEKAVNRIKDQNPKQVALVVGHDSTIPPMLKLFGHPERITIAPTEYDNLFVMVLGENARPTVLRLRY